MTTSGSSFTFKDFRDLVYVSMGDPDMANYGEDLVFNATIGAIFALMPWCPKPALYEIICDGSGSTFDLPVDLYKLEAVQEKSTGIFLNRMSISPGQARTINARTTSTTDWVLYPKNKLWLNKVYEAGTVLYVFYQAYYAMPKSASDLTFVMETPRSAMFGMCYWAMAHTLMPDTNSNSILGQFKTKVDSGTPMDNVIQQTAEFYRKLFIDEMSRQPKYVGAVT